MAIELSPFRGLTLAMHVPAAMIFFGTATVRKRDWCKLSDAPVLTVDVTVLTLDVT